MPPLEINEGNCLCFCVFVEAGNSSVTQREFVKMKKQNQSLQEENNLLKLKMEILLDMVSVGVKLEWGVGV